MEMDLVTFGCITTICMVLSFYFPMKIYVDFIPFYYLYKIVSATYWGIYSWWKYATSSRALIVFIIVMMMMMTKMVMALMLMWMMMTAILLIINHFYGFHSFIHSFNWKCLFVSVASPFARSIIVIIMVMMSLASASATAMGMMMVLADVESLLFKVVEIFI